MAFGLKKEKEIERWLRPYTGAALLPGRDRCLVENTRLFFMLYWHLLKFGLSEEQIADYAGLIRDEDRIHEELALSKAVFNLATDWNIVVTPDLFSPGTDKRWAA